MRTHEIDRCSFEQGAIFGAGREITPGSGRDLQVQHPAPDSPMVESKSIWRRIGRWVAFLSYLSIGLVMLVIAGRLKVAATEYGLGLFTAISIAFFCAAWTCFGASALAFCGVVEQESWIDTLGGQGDDEQ